MSSSPPDGLSLRPATVDDAPAINELITAADEAVQGWSESSESESSESSESESSESESSESEPSAESVPSASVVSSLVSVPSFIVR